MALAAVNEKSASLFESVDNSNKPKSSERVTKTHTQELVIALCGPIGSQLHEVASSFEEVLTSTFGYTKCTKIRMSSLIEEHSNRVGITIPNKDGFDRIETQIKAGNKLRETYGPSVLAELAINTIRLDREQHKVAEGSETYTSRRICHIIDSIKNQEELDLLRMIYREMVYVVGVFSPLEQREANLSNKGLDVAKIYNLIDKDSGEEHEAGQTVRNTFPQSDFFLRTDSGTDSQVKKRVERFLHLILGTEIITPTPNESAMYAAASAASSSACLSRQVGAAITSSKGEVISVGWNDVPKAGGGLYQSGGTEDSDKRCWNIGGGKCFNDEEKQIFATQLLYAIEEIIPENIEEKDKIAMLDNAKKAIGGFSKLKNLIEFSRSIHAEMHAIINAGKVFGDKISGGKLFVTTYPCHSCARHIVAAGISEVYYIEPYRKSLATKLHGDSISEKEADLNKVRLLPFDGIAPGRYLDLFRMKPDSRKNKGIMIRVDAKNSTPKLEKSLYAFTELEGLVVKSLIDHKLITVGEVKNEETETSTPAA